MINRILIRIKIVQMIYAYMLNKEGKTPLKAKNDLKKSFDKTYELYIYMLLLLVELTDMQDRNLDDAKHKFLPTEADLNPNTKFVDNKVVRLLRENADFVEYLKENPITWKDDDIFMRLMLSKITHSEIYQSYMASESDSLSDDGEMWVKVMKYIILPDAHFNELLEEKSSLWNGESELVGQFATKAVRRIAEGVENPILPKFRNDEDEQYAYQLFDKAIAQIDENNALIDAHLSTNWDKDRLAFMDRLIMCVCLTEIREFVTVPITVSLTEYTTLAKFYSTSKSCYFVKGVLHNAVNQLLEEGKIINR